MKLKTPRWWYVQTPRRARLLPLLLTPLSWIWAAVTARRIARAHPIDPGAPVICVGNLTLGGTGKTPIVAAVLQVLTAGGRRAHALSRGYGGRLAGPLQVDPGAHTAAEVGDESLILARAAPVWIARDRAAGALAATAAGAEVVVMDDGHQNPSVKKRLSLVVVDGETRDGEWPFGDGAVFPAGPMREPLKAGLARADAVVVLLPVGMDRPAPELLGLFADKPVLVARLEPAGPPPQGPQLGFAGVGKPWKVERALRAAGCDLEDFAPLPDHAPLDEPLLRALQARAEALGAGLVTTEKDWARLPSTWRARVTPWPVRAAFEDVGALESLLAAALSG